MILSSKFLEFTNQKSLETIIANPETAKQKLLQTVALIALANGFFNIKKARLKQATVNLGAGTILWMNQEALELTQKNKKAFYWSRSRKKIWEKGEESGHVQNRFTNAMNEIQKCIQTCSKIDVWRSRI